MRSASVRLSASSDAWHLRDGGSSDRKVGWGSAVRAVLQLSSASRALSNLNLVSPRSEPAYAYCKLPKPSRCASKPSSHSLLGVKPSGCPELPASSYSAAMPWAGSNSVALGSTPSFHLLEDREMRRRPHDIDDLQRRALHQPETTCSPGQRGCQPEIWTRPSMPSSGTNAPKGTGLVTFREQSDPSVGASNACHGSSWVAFRDRDTLAVQVHLENLRRR